MRVIQIVKEKDIYTINTDKIISINLYEEDEIVINTVDNGIYEISSDGKSFSIEVSGTNKLSEKESVKHEFDDIKELYDTIVDFVIVTIDEINKMIISNR